MLLTFFYKGISPFLDPVTRDKVIHFNAYLTPANCSMQMRFNPNLKELIPLSHLDAEFGGENGFEFDSNSYWDQIVSLVSFLHIWHALIHSARACGIAPDGTRVTIDKDFETNGIPIRFVLLSRLDMKMFTFRSAIHAP